MAAKRRGHGEGSIYQRKDGKWCASIYLGTINGKPKRKTFYGHTRKEVSEKLKIGLRDQQRGVNIAPKRMTVAQFLDLWLEQVVKTSNRPRTYESYHNTVRLHITPAIGHHQLTKLTAVHVQEMLNALRATSLTRTVVLSRAVLVIALNIAVKWEYVQRNVAELTEVPTVNRRDIQPLTKEQARALLEGIKGHRLEVLYRMALSLGLRRGEVLGLRWADVDFAQSTIHISGALQRQQKHLERTATKTKAGNRVLPLPAVLAQALQAHYTRQATERKPPGWIDHGYIFPSIVGTPMEPRNLNRHFTSLLTRLKLPKTTRLHDLRHSAATLMLLQGVPLKVISQILGHAQLSITADIYTHVLPDLERDATDRMDALFDASEPKQDNGEGEENSDEGAEMKTNRKTSIQSSVFYQIKDAPALLASAHYRIVKRLRQCVCLFLGTSDLLNPIQVRYQTALRPVHRISAIVAWERAPVNWP